MRGPLDWGRRLGPNILLLYANTFFVFAGLGIFVLVFNLYLASLGYKEDYIGLFSFANAAAIGAFAVPAGMLSNRYSPRLCLLVASLLMGLTSALISLVASPVLMVVGGLVLGVANALIFVPSAPFLMDNSGEGERLTVFSGNFAAMSVASVLGSLASGYLPLGFAWILGLAEAQSTPAYRLTLLVGAAICLLGAAPMALVRPIQRGRSEIRLGVPAVAPVREREVRRVMVAFAVSVILIALSMGLILPFFNVYFAERLGASVEQIGVIYAIASLAMVPCTLLGPVVARRFGTVAGIALARLGTAPFIFCLALTPPLALGALAYVARAAFMSVTWPLDNAFAMELMPPRLRGLQAGVRSACWNVGWSVASLIAGQLIVAVGYPIVFVASGIFTLAGTVFHYAFFRRHQARRPELAREAART